MGGPSFTEETTDGSIECWVGVRGEESIRDGEVSDCVGERPGTITTCSGATEVASESIVTSDAAFIFLLRDEDDLPGGRALDGLDVLALVIAGDFARTVLGCEPVVEVMSVLSVPSNMSSRMLERDAALGPAVDVMRVPLSALRLSASISFTSTTSFRRMLFALAVFRRSAAVVAVSGGLGGARGGVGATRFGSCGAAPSTSVASGESIELRRGTSSRAYMLSLACVLDSVGYDRLVLEALADPNEPRRSISGTMAILCDLDDCVDEDVRMRSPDGRSRGRSPSGSSSFDVEERGLRALVLR